MDKITRISSVRLENCINQHTTREMAGNAQSAARETQNAHESISRVADVTSQTSQSSETALAKARELSGHADHLREQVKRFLEHLRSS